MKTAQDIKESVEGSENTRSANWQRSTDPVSPTAAVEKKVRLSGGTVAACASPNAGHTWTAGNDVERHVSYARAGRVIGRSGPNMDEVRGIALRMALEDCHMRYFFQTKTIRNAMDQCSGQCLR